MSRKSKAAQDIELVRCPWGGIEVPIYAEYHDTEWGVPQFDDRALFEKLILEGFQSGLSWLTILKKRENFRAAFKSFDPEKIARFTDNDRTRLMADTGIIRNRLKIDATIENAKSFLEVSEKESFSGLLWGMLDGPPIANKWQTFAEVPAQTDISKRMSKELKKRGFRFVGPTTAYAFMQSVGMVNDHLVSCHRHAPCAELQARAKLPA
ncbi:MAG: DNA-3-methyladenine glycosylase I [Filomicrobium sp.]